MSIKSGDKLVSFTAYCQQHPEERFWQALRNWSEYSFIYGSDGLIDSCEMRINVEDTFYKE